MKLAILTSFALLATTQVLAEIRVDGPEPYDQAIGYYSEGRLRAATPLPDEGDGFVHLFRGRDRGWGTQGVIELIEQAASGMRDSYPDGERLQIGDVAAERGGEISGHASHQDGLDADIVYFRRDHREQPLDHVSGFDESFVIGGIDGTRLSPNFDLERNWAVLKSLVSTGRVKMIFVHSVIKGSICRYARGIGELGSGAETLRRLRGQPMHYDHFHVRLTCPPTSPRCEKQSDPPSGSGCAT